MPTDSDSSKFSTPLTLGEFRRLTAHLPDDALFQELSHSESRVVMQSDILVEEGPLDLDDYPDLVEDLGDEVTTVPGLVILSAHD